MDPAELKNISVLQTMDADSLSRLAAVVERRDYADGQAIFAEGDPGDSMYFLVEGRVRIEKQAGAKAGHTKTLSILEAGDYFGEMALLEQKPRSAAALADGGALVLRLSREAFEALQLKSGTAGWSVLFAMIRTAGERIRRLSSQVIVYDEVGRALGEAQSLQALLDVILQQLQLATGADWGLLLLRAQFSDRLELRSHVDVPLQATQKEALNEGRGFLKPTLEDPKDTLVSDLSVEEPYCSCPRLGFETASLLLSPILLERQFLGVIVLGGNEPAKFDANDLNLTRGVARQAAQAILNARHREEQEARSRHSRQFVRF